MKKASALRVFSPILHLFGVSLVSPFQTLAPLCSFSRKHTPLLPEGDPPRWLASARGVTPTKEISASAIETKLYSSGGRRGDKDWRTEDIFLVDDDQYGAFDYRRRDSTYFDESSKEEEEDNGFESTEGLAQWESCEYGNAKVLFPQTNLLKNIDDDEEEEPRLPKAIIHFIGGTGFGSLPQFAYGHLLEELSSKGNYIVVSTPPLSSLEELSSPLDHYRIAYEMARNFRIAYRSLLEDEYGVTTAQSIPIVGLGHSLGSRIHVVCATQSKLRRLAFPRAGNILLSFNNFYATRSIPFLYEVGMLSKQAAQGLLQRKELQELKGNTSKPNAWMSSSGDEIGPGGSSRRELNRNEPRSSRRQRRRDVLDGIEDEIDSLDGDEDIDESSFASRSAYRRRRSRYNGRTVTSEPGLREQAKRGVEWATDTLTAQLDRLSTSLEFSPSPEELVEMVSQGKYGVRKSLLVQFDMDDIDQSVLLAKAIMGRSSSSSSRAAATNEATSATISGDDRNEDDADVDLKFARLKGNHLTPIFKGRRSKDQREELQNQVETEESGIKQQENDSDLTDLVSTITTYIEQVILKEEL
jgi:hypothetical protein